MSRRRRATVAAAAANPSVAPAVPTSPVPARPLFIASIALSALLLFTLELLAGRLVLPVFGGAPAVWTTALCFFTGVLFLGYVYAHVVVTRLGRRRGGVVHLVLAAAVVVAAILAPSDLASLRNPQLPEALNVLLVLTLIAGPAVFLLTTTSPLLSAWFAGRGGDPWWLYATSNAASLVGLLAYPVFLEPFLPLSIQRGLVTALLVALVALLASVVVSGRGGAPTPDRPAIAAAGSLTARRQVLWLVAAAVPAGLLAATTTHLAVDLVSAPLLWVGPLAIYLASLVVAFSERGRRVLPVVERLVPTAATLMWISYAVPGGWPVLVLLLFLLASYAVVAIALHGRLALDRPDEAHLTRYYLIISAGGLLATAFVALVAPFVFNDIYEYPVLLVAGLGVLALIRGPGGWLTGALDLGRDAQRAIIRLAPYLGISAVLLLLVVLDEAPMGGTIALIFALGAAVIAVARSPRILAAGTGVAIAVTLALNSPSPFVQVRTFFGVIDVRSSYFGLARSEFSGTTLHGLQFLDERRSEPTTYYVKAGPLGQIFASLGERLPDGAAIGSVGLGVGTVAAYVRPTDTMTFFEIDQAVVDLARDTRYYTYLANAASPPTVILGDARLSLAEQRAGSFDLLILDAFSSDAVPSHLLTREAMQLYVRTLRPGGILAFHLSNRYYDLDPAVGSTARAIGLNALANRYVADPPTPEGLAARSSIWVVAGAADEIEGLVERGWSRPVPGPVLTDDFPDLLRTLRFP
jgi:SAM-dependent methyltransferase